MGTHFHPYACFACRRSFKRTAAGRLAAKCPTCGAWAVLMNRKFKPPPQTDEQQWEKVRFLHEHGFRFQTVYDENGLSVQYPQSLEEAREFIRQYPARRTGVALRRAPKASRRRGQRARALRVARA